MASVISFSKQGTLTGVEVTVDDVTVLHVDVCRSLVVLENHTVEAKTAGKTSSIGLLT
jgi:hypothetical protein